jgi:hypothetical protein
VLREVLADEKLPNSSRTWSISLFRAERNDLFASKVDVGLNHVDCGVG